MHLCCSQPDTTPAPAGTTLSSAQNSRRGFEPCRNPGGPVWSIPHVQACEISAEPSLPASCSTACLRAQLLPQLAHLHLRMLFLNSCNACPFLHGEILSKPCFFFFFSLLSKQCMQSSGICCSPATCAPSTATPRALPNIPRCREQLLWVWNSQRNP